MIDKKDSRIKIEKVVLRIAGKELPLSIEEAKELKKELDSLFGLSVLTYGKPYSNHYTDTKTNVVENTISETDSNTNTCKDILHNNL